MNIGRNSCFSFNCVEEKYYVTCIDMFLIIAFLPSTALIVFLNAVFDILPRNSQWFLHWAEDSSTSTAFLDGMHLNNFKIPAQLPESQCSSCSSHSRTHPLPTLKSKAKAGRAWAAVCKTQFSFFSSNTVGMLWWYSHLSEGEEIGLNEMKPYQNHSAPHVYSMHNLRIFPPGSHERCSLFLVLQK